LDKFLNLYIFPVNFDGFSKPPDSRGGNINENF
jgi:hypothetical protein